MSESSSPDRFVDLLRHGEVSGGSRLRGVTNDPLSDRGFAQMEAALAGVDPVWTEIVSSGLQRCDEFARGLAQRLGVAHRVMAEFSEIDFGDWEGRSVDRLWTETPEFAESFWRDPFSVTPPGGEAPAAMKRRVQRGWERLLNRLEPGGHCLLVTHGGPIRVLLGEVLDMPDSALVRLEVPHASLSRLRIPAGDWPTSLVFHRGAV